MKIKSIAAICKVRKRITLFTKFARDGSVVQYIGDGIALYPISGLPPLDDKNVLIMFDVPEKQWDDWFVECAEIPEGINPLDVDPEEKLVEKSELSLIYAGRTLKPLYAHQGLLLIENRYLAPIADLDKTEFYERRAIAGQPYIAVKSGMIVNAIIMPYEMDGDTFINTLKYVTRECTRRVQWPKSWLEGGENATPDQCEIDPKSQFPEDE